MMTRPVALLFLKHRKEGDATRWVESHLSKTLIINLRTLGGVALCCLALILAGCVSLPKSEIISNDRGGYVVQYALKIAKEKEPHIVGLCASSCTLRLGHPRVCVGPRAVLIFHSAWGSSPSSIRAANAYMLSRYPAEIRTWINSNGGLTKRQLTLSGKAAMKFMRRCK